MEVQSFGNVWDALCDTPAKSADMTARSDLMFALQRTIGGWDVRRKVVARRLGITRARVGDLLTGRIGTFPLGALVALTSRAGLAETVF